MFVNKEGELRSGWILILTAMVIVTLVVVGCLAFALPALVYMQNRGMMSFDTGEFTAQGIAFMDKLDFSFSFVILFIYMLVAVIGVRVCRKRSLASMGFRFKRENRKEFLMGVLIGAGLAVILIGGICMMDTVTIYFEEKHILLKMFQWFLTILTSSFTSEVIYRGYIMCTLRQTKSVSLVFFVPTVVYSFMHFTFPGTDLLTYINMALLSVVCGYMFYRTGSLCMSFGFHLAYSFLIGIAGAPYHGTQYFENIKFVSSNDTLINGGGFGPEASIIATVLFLVTFLTIRYLLSKYKYKFFEDDGILTKKLKKNDEFGGILDTTRHEQDI